MKLVQTPITDRMNLDTMYPNIAKYTFNQQPIKFYKLYALDRTQIVYADTHDAEVLLLLNTKRKIHHEEVDVVLRRLMHATRKEVTVNAEYKKQLKADGVTMLRPYKDIIMITKKKAITG